MPLHVIGAGLGRTGTLSLKLALEQLGLGPCYHMMEVRAAPERLEHWNRIAAGEQVDWDEVFAGFQSTVDWPACNYWRELMARYPDAKVILSLRDPDGWFRSTQATIFSDEVQGGAPPSIVQDHHRRRRQGPARSRALHRRVRAPQRGGAGGRARGGTAGVRREAGLGAAVRVPRRAGAGRAVPERQHHRRLPQDDRAPGERGLVDLSETRGCIGSERNAS